MQLHMFVDSWTVLRKNDWQQPIGHLLMWQQKIFYSTLFPLSFIYIDNKESSRIIRIKVKFNKDKSKILQHFSNKSIKQFTWKKKQEL